MFYGFYDGNQQTFVFLIIFELDRFHEKMTQGKTKQR